MSQDCCIFMMGTRRRKIASIVMPVVLLITSFVLLNPILPRAVASQSHSSILIVGNAEFTPANGVTGGTGTASDPYVIQGWNINMCWQCPYYGIEVANTTAYFRIFNVTVSSLITAQPATDILLKNATNGRIDNSVVQDESILCCGGIIVDSSRNVVLNANNAEAGNCKKFSSCSADHTVWGFRRNHATHLRHRIRAHDSVHHL